MGHMQINYWQRAARKSRMDKIRNQRIREMMKVDKNFLEVIEERKLRWFGHVNKNGRRQNSENNFGIEC